MSIHIVKLFVYYVALVIAIALAASLMNGCATGKIGECSSLCRGNKVEFFKDDVTECKCNLEQRK